MIALTLDLSRIERKRIFIGKTGKKYLSFVLVDGPDQFGNDGRVVQSISKEERLAGVKGEICGNWRHVGRPSVRSEVKKAPSPTEGAEERGLFQ
jgi:hypothetical protein